MSYTIYSSGNWQPVDGAKTVFKICPRCHNEVDLFWAVIEAGHLFLAFAYIIENNMF